MESPQPTQDSLISNRETSIDQSAVRFTDKGLLSAMFAEVINPRVQTLGILTASSQVLPVKSLHATDTCDESSSEKTLISYGTHSNNFNGESCFDEQDKLQPPPSQIYYLWQVFLERVHPLTKVIHAPTVQPYLVKGVSSTGGLPKGMQALIFSIFALATLSLSDDESWNMLGSSREHAFQRFSAGLRTALQHARYLELPNLTLLQALTLYLVSAMYSATMRH